MPTFIKTGYWEKIQKGYNGWLNLDNLIASSVGTGTPGQIAYFGTSGLTGSNNLIWDDVNGKIGINAPSLSRGVLNVQGAYTDEYLSGNGQLSVIGNVNGLPENAGNGGTIVLGGSTSSADLNRTFASISGRKENSTNGNRAGYLAFGTRRGSGVTTDIVERMRIDSVGSVGIGTTAPIGPLDVVSDGGGQMYFSRYGGQPQINIRRSQGTFAVPTAVVNGASSVLNFQNYNGTAFATSAQIQSVPTTQSATDAGATLALNVVQGLTTTMTNGLIVSGNNATAGAISITNAFNGPSARLTIWQSTLNTTLDYFDIVNSGGGQLLRFFNNGNLVVGGNANSTFKLDVVGTIRGTQYNLSALNTAPASATATGTLGEIRIDANHIYVCTATNTWKRVAIATW